MKDRYLKTIERKPTYRPYLYVKPVKGTQRMTILICGSRDWTDYDLIFNELSNLVYDKNLSQCLLIEGGARGADALARKAARELGIEVKTVYAKWSRGKFAGFMRNKQMVDMGPDIVLAFQKNKSKGTQITIDLAAKKGIKTLIYEEFD